MLRCMCLNCSIKFEENQRDWLPLCPECGEFVEPVTD